jgi:hypothetical protein
MMETQVHCFVSCNIFKVYPVYLVRYRRWNIQSGAATHKGSGPTKTDVAPCGFGSTTLSLQSNILCMLFLLFVDFKNLSEIYLPV